MARLAEYMREFAELLGDRDSVHFAGIVKGSAVLRAYVNDEFSVDATRRILGARSGDASKEVTDRTAKIDRLMKQDSARGEILRRDGNVLYAFEGAKRSELLEPEVSVTQDGELIGSVMRIGGRDESVPLLLQDSDGNFYEANIKGRELARKVAGYLFGQPIRVSGSGTWTRSADGKWKLDRFIVQSFEELDDRPLSDVINEIRAIPDYGWSKEEDPLDEWHHLRG